MLSWGSRSKAPLFLSLILLLSLWAGRPVWAGGSDGSVTRFDPWAALNQWIQGKASDPGPAAKSESEEKSPTNPVPIWLDQEIASIRYQDFEGNSDGVEKITGQDLLKAANVQPPMSKERYLQSMTARGANGEAIGLSFLDLFKMDPDVAYRKYVENLTRTVDSSELNERFAVLALSRIIDRWTVRLRVPEQELQARIDYLVSALIVSRALANKDQWENDVQSFLPGSRWRTGIPDEKLYYRLRDKIRSIEPGMAAQIVFKWDYNKAGLAPFREALEKQSAQSQVVWPETVLLLKTMPETAEEFRAVVERSLIATLQGSEPVQQLRVDTWVKLAEMHYPQRKVELARKFEAAELEVFMHKLIALNVLRSTAQLNDVIQGELTKDNRPKRVHHFVKEWMKDRIFGKYDRLLAFHLFKANPISNSVSLCVAEPSWPCLPSTQLAPRLFAEALFPEEYFAKQSQPVRGVETKYPAAAKKAFDERGPDEKWSILDTTPSFAPVLMTLSPSCPGCEPRSSTLEYDEEFDAVAKIHRGSLMQVFSNSSGFDY